MEYLFEYLSFLAKAVTIVIAVLVVIAAIASLRARRPFQPSGHLEVTKLNDRLKDLRRSLEHSFLPRSQFRTRLRRERKAESRSEKRAKNEDSRRRVFVLTFIGDLAATQVERLRNEITAVLTVARPDDEVVVRVESAGGLVHGYGLAASELDRVKQHGIKLTVAVDKVAASGGYLMASVANQVIAAPFAVVGSIGVIAQVPNVHRFLKKHDVDVEVLTAGEYKRTLTVLGENTEEGRRKLREELEDVHSLFQEYVAQNRPGVDLREVATGETWYGKRAIDRRLIDVLATSDEYLVRACETADVYEVKWIEQRKPMEKLMAYLR